MSYFTAKDKIRARKQTENGTRDIKQFSNGKIVKGYKSAQSIVLNDKK